MKKAKTAAVLKRNLCNSDSPKTTDRELIDHTRTSVRSMKPNQSAHPRVFELSRIYELSIKSIQNPKSDAREHLKNELKMVKDNYHTREIIQESKINTFSYKKSRLVIGTESSDIKLYQILNDSITVGSEMIKGHKDSVQCLQLTKDARMMFSWSLDKTIILWELIQTEDGDQLKESFSIKQIIREHGETYYSKKMDLLWSDQKKLLLARVDHNVIIFELGAFNLLEVRQKFDIEAKIDRVFMSKDGECLVSNSFDEDLNKNIRKIWRYGEFGADVFSVDHAFEKVKRSFRLTSALFTGSKMSLVIIELHGLIKIFMMQKKSKKYKRTYEIMTDIDDIGPADMSNRGNYLIIGSREGSLLIYKHNKIGEYCCIDSSQTHEEAISCAKISDSLAYIITSSEDRTLKIRTIQSILEQTGAEKGQDGEDYNLECSYLESILEVKISRDARLMVVLAVLKKEDKMPKNSIKFFMKKKDRRFSLSTEFVSKTKLVAISDNSNYILTESNGVVVRYQYREFSKCGYVSELDEVKTGHDVITALEFFPNSENFMTGGKDGSIRIWIHDPDFKQANGSEKFTGHSEAILRLQATLDHQWLVSASDDNFVKIWKNSEFGDEIKYQEHSGENIKSKKKIKNFYYTAKEPKLLLVANCEGEIVVYRRSCRTSKYLVTQKIRKATSRAKKEFLMEVFDNERHMMTMGDKGTSLKIWHINENGLIYLYDVGRIYTFCIHAELSLAFIVQKHAKNKVNILRLRAKPRLPKENFEQFKLISNLFNGDAEDIIDKAKVDPIIKSYSKMLSPQGHHFYRGKGERGSVLGTVVPRGASQFPSVNRPNFMEPINGHVMLPPSRDEIGSERSEMELSDHLGRRPSIQMPGAFRRMTGNVIQMKNSSRNKAMRQNQYKAYYRLRDDRIIHSQLNPVLLGVLSKEPTILKKMLTKFGHKGFYYGKTLKAASNRDPFDVALTIDNLTILDTIAHHIKNTASAKTTEKRNSFLSYLSLRRFRLIMKCSSEHLKMTTMDQCFFQPETLDGTTLLEVYPIPVKHFTVFQSTSLLFDSELKNHIIDKANSQSKLYKNVPIRVKMFRFPFSESLFSRSANLLLQAGMSMSDTMLKSDYKYVIIYLWRENFYTILMMTALNILSYILFVLYIVWFSEKPLLGILSIMMSSFFLSYELVSIFKDVKKWASSFSNYLDICQYLNMPVLVALNLIGNLSMNQLSVNLWISITLLIAGFRTFAELRIFDSIRTLIAMINQTLIDMTSFMITLFFMTLIFCIVSINVSKTTDDPILRITDLFLTMDYYYNLANGNWEPDITKHFNMNQLIHFYISGIILAVMMMNLLIAVISLTFDRFYQIQELVDLRERSLLLHDHSEFFCTIKRIFGLNWLGDDKKESFNHCFLIKRIQNISDEVLNNVKEIARKVGDCENKIDDANAQFRDDIEEVKKSLDEKFGEMRRMMEKLLRQRRLDEGINVIGNALIEEEIESSEVREHASGED